MRVRVESEDDVMAASLREAGDFKSFCVEIPASLLADVGMATRDGAVEFASRDEAWVDKRWLMDAGEFHPGSPAAESFEAMLTFAVERGWFDPQSGRIAAHVERT
jgi:hypothetical protein